MVAGLPLKITATIGTTRRKFLIDTGSSISILPYLPGQFPILRPTGLNLTNASGDNITCYGEFDTELGIRVIRRSFPWSFVVADVVEPILGIDFLSHYDLLVDCKNNSLIDNKTQNRISLEVSNIKVSSYHVTLDSIDPRARKIVEKHPILTSPLRYSEETPKAPTGIYHNIDTVDSNPVHVKPRPLTGAKLEAAKAEFQFLLKAGRIQRSNSPWATPLHLVPKKEPGTYRPCGDFRQLNSITIADKYPVPHLRSLTMSLHNKNVFSKLDLQRAYLQIPVNPNDVPKTAVTTPFGLFEYLYMPFGLKNAGSTFQRFMDTIFANVPNVFIYLDDVLIASENESEHIDDISRVMSILADNDLRLTLSKCEFFKKSLTFLGYEVGDDGIRPPSDRVTAIQNFALPQNSTELRRFMGMLNFFRHMIPDFANIAFPVTELLRNNPKAKELSWTDTARDSFEKLKQSLAQCPTLKFPSPEISHYQLVTDASNHAVGAALYQMIDNKPHPISFFSKKLSQPQRTLSTYDRELLGAYLAVLNFKTLIDGHNLTLFVDHKPLVSAFYSKNLAKSDRQQRQLSFLSEYVSDIQYVRGQDNIVADCLSRPVCASQVDVFDIQGLAQAQLNDPEIETYKDRLKSYNCTPNLQLWCDFSTPIPRPFVPDSLRTNVIAFLHKLSHPSIKTTTKLVKQRYFWPSMDKDIKAYVYSCVDCQRAKVNRHTRSAVEPISSPTDRFQTVHIDIVTLPPASHPSPVPYRYLLTCIDRATRWCEAIPLLDISSVTVAIAFLSGWIARFGVPLHVVTDRGAQFESDLFAELSKLVGFHHVRTTSYHPQSNGFIERLHRTLKSSLMARAESWYTSLPVVLLGLRMSPNSLQYSPFTAVTGSYMLCPHPLIDKTAQVPTNDDTLNQFLKDMHSLNFYDYATGTCHSNPSSYIPSDLFTVPKVWLRVDRVRRSLEAPYSGPFEVIKRDPKYFVLKLPQGETSVSIDRLKPAHLPSPLQQSLPSTTPITPPESHSDSTPKVNDNSNESDVQNSVEDLARVPRTTRSGRNVRFNLKPEYSYF